MDKEDALATLLAAAAGHEEWGAGVQLPAVVGDDVSDCYHVRRAAGVAQIPTSSINEARDVVLITGLKVAGVLDVEGGLLYVNDRSDVPSET